MGRMRINIGSRDGEYYVNIGQLLKGRYLLLNSLHNGDEDISATDFSLMMSS